jgi:hypothetical protein
VLAFAGLTGIEVCKTKDVMTFVPGTKKAFYDKLVDS